MSSEASVWAPETVVIDSELRTILSTATSPTTGAGYVAYDDDITYPAGSTGKAIKDLEQEVNNIVAETTVGYTSFLTFGGNGDGVTLNDAAFVAALAATDRLYIPTPAVCYLISQPIAVALSNLKILGESRNLTKIRMNNASLPVFSIAPGLDNVELNTLKLERSVPASATGSGIECSGASTSHYFRDLNIEGHWDGIVAGETQGGQVVNCLSYNNYNHGIKIVSGSSAYAVWDLRDSRFYNNNGDGINIVGSGVAADVALGSVSNVYGVFNAGYGLRAVGASAKKLSSLRVAGGTFSFNGAGGMYLDTYGSRHRVTEFSANLNGTTLTGRANSVAISNAGDGIYATVNNQDISIVGGTASDNSYSGLRIEASLATVIGNNCNDNGKNASAVAADRSGIRAATGRLLIQGNTLSNRTAGAGTQQQGLHLTDGTNCVVDGNNCAGNMAASIALAGTSTTNRIVS